MEHYQSHWSADSSGPNALPAGPWAGHHFEECTFEGLDLTGYDFRNVRFEQCVFRNCTLESVRLTGTCLLYTSPSPRDGLLSRMPSSA